MIKTTDHDGDAPIRKDTIKHLRFWVRQYPFSEELEYAAVLIHEGGVEYPILTSGDWVWGADADWTPPDDERVEPSDDFYDALEAVMEGRAFGGYDIEDYESYLIAQISRFAVRGELSFEMEWLIEQTSYDYDK